MNNLSLDPEHYTDLQKSGLSDNTIREAGIKSVPPNQINMKLGFLIPGLVSMYEIQFDGDYSRFKAFYEDGKTFFKDGNEKPKYLARKKSGNRLYIPSKVKATLQDVSIPLDITEGEKKALKACQDGLKCIAITGLWNYKVKGKDELIPDFNKIALDGRTIYLVPDNDWLLPNRKGERKNLKQAVHGLAYLLIDRGAKVYWRELPQGELKGIDDYLFNHSVYELKQLPVHEIRKLTLDEILNTATPDTPSDGIQEIIKRIAKSKKESEKAQYINRLYEKTKIKKSAIISDIKGYLQKDSSEDEYKQALFTNFPELIGVIKKYGDMYYWNVKGNAIILNEAFWAGLHNTNHIQLYEPSEKSFYRYDDSTGLYKDISTDVIKQEVSGKILNISRNQEIYTLEKERTNKNLNSIVDQLKGISEKRNAFSKNGKKTIHLANGVLAFKDDEADLVEFSPEFYSRNQSPIPFDVTAQCPRFLNELLYPATSLDDAVLIQKYAGLCLLGNNLIQRFLILDGKAGRGKSTLSLIIQRLVGLNNVTELRTKHLSERFELYRFLKRTLLIGVDVPGDFLSQKGAQVIKGLVGGDWMDAEQKGGTGSFQIQGNYCIVITSNSRLRVRLDGDIEAWKRRSLIVRFEAPPPEKKIPHFADILIKVEGSGILNWALQGLAMILDDIKSCGDISMTGVQNGVVDALLAESDSLRHFLTDCVIRDENADLSVAEIEEAYMEYCPSKQWTPKPIYIVRKELEQYMLELFQVGKSHSISREGKSTRGYRRVSFKEKIWGK